MPPTGLDFKPTWAAARPEGPRRGERDERIPGSVSAGGAAPAWTEYLVIVPQLDGTSRIDDILFATRRSDTLRSRMSTLAGWN